MLLEAFRCDYRYIAALDLIGADNAGYAAEVVDVRMADYYAHHRELAELLVYELLCGLRALHRHQRIKHYPTGIALYEGYIGHVVAAHLIYAIAYFKQSIYVVELGVAPQAGVGGIRGLLEFVQERIRILAPDELAALVVELQRFGRADQPARGKLILLLVVKVELIVDCLIDLSGYVCRALGFGSEFILRAGRGGQAQNKGEQGYGYTLHVVDPTSLMFHPAAHCAA